MLEKLEIKTYKKNDDIVQDKLFYSLVKVMVNDYFSIKEKYQEEPYIPFEVGKELGSDLHEGFVLLNMNDKETKKHCRKVSMYEESVDVFDEDFIENFEPKLTSDGARVIKNNKVVMEAGIYYIVDKAEKKMRGSIDDVLKNCLGGAYDLSAVGERTTNALAAAIALNKNTYALSKTIKGGNQDVYVGEENEKTRFTHIGTGLISEFGPHGIVRRVILDDTLDCVEDDYILDKDKCVYIKQNNYIKTGDMVALDSSYCISPDDLETLINLESIDEKTGFFRKLLRL